MKENDCLSDDSQSYQLLSLPLDDPITPSNPKSGWLLKRTSGVIHRWVKRYFLLTNSELAYYYNSDLSTLGGILNFDLLTLELQILGSILRLSSFDGKKVFKIKAESYQAAKDWAYQISKSLHNSNGQKLLLKIPSKPRFWKFQRISESEFKTTALTGDLLLFKGKGFCAKTQRLFTKSEYNHVALVLRFCTGELGLLEASSLNGVSILHWDDIKAHQWKKLHSKIVYRRLSTERGLDFSIAIELFVSYVQGRNYKLPWHRRIKEQEDEDPKIKDSYFCSELIAMAYKFIGILPKDPPAHEYWPGAFQDSRNLSLLCGAVLHPGKVIDFDLPRIL